MISGTRYRLTMEINRQLALARDIARAQTEISTGKRIQAAVRRPGRARRASPTIARAQANEAAWKSNLDLAAALAVARRHRARGRRHRASTARSELMVAGANGTLSAENRATIALELRAIADELAALEGQPATRAANRCSCPTDALQHPGRERRHGHRRRHPRGGVRERRHRRRARGPRRDRLRRGRRARARARSGARQAAIAPRSTRSTPPSRASSRPARRAGRARQPHRPVCSSASPIPASS